MINQSHLVVFGSNSNGQLSLPNEEENREINNAPTIIDFSIPIIKISCGGEHSAFITDNYFLYTFGSNKLGQLGIENEIQYSNVPVLVEIFSEQNLKCVSVSCGTNHTLAIVDKSILYAWGSNQQGQLGIEQICNFNMPQKIHTEINVSKISAGDKHSGFIDINNNVFVFGSNEKCQLGINQSNICTLLFIKNFKAKSLSCGITHTLFLSLEGEVFQAGRESVFKNSNSSHSKFRQVTLLQGQKIVKISASNISAALNQNGVLYVWGEQDIDKHLIKEKEQSIVDISLGLSFGCAIDANGQLYTWGNNQFLKFPTEQKGNYLENIQKINIDNKVFQKVSCGSNHVIALSQQYKVLRQLNNQKIQNYIDSNLQKKQEQETISEEIKKQIKITSQQNQELNKQILYLLNQQQEKDQKLSKILQKNNLVLYNNILDIDLNKFQQENDNLIEQNRILKHEIKYLYQQIHEEQVNNQLKDQIECLKEKLIQVEQDNMFLSEKIKMNIMQ